MNIIPKLLDKIQNTYFEGFQDCIKCAKFARNKGLSLDDVIDSLDGALQKTLEDKLNGRLRSDLRGNSRVNSDI